MTGIQAGLIISHTKVHWEPLNLAHCCPTSCPGDLQLILPQPMCHLPFCHLQKLQLTFMLQVPFLPSLLVTSHIWLVPITTHLQFAEQEKFCGPPSILQAFLLMAKWLFVTNCRDSQLLM
jgi:hypothetical protein